MKMIFSASLLLAVLSLSSSAPLPEESQEIVHIPYNFAYEVSDPASNNFYNRVELKNENGEVIGSYSVYMPDGLIYTTSYRADADNGYVANLVISEPETSGQIEVESVQPESPQ